MTIMQIHMRTHWKQYQVQAIVPILLPVQKFGFAQTPHSTSVGTMAGLGTLHYVQNLRFSFWIVIINYQ